MARFCESKCWVNGFLRGIGISGCKVDPNIGQKNGGSQAMISSPGWNLSIGPPGVFHDQAEGLPIPGSTNEAIPSRRPAETVEQIQSNILSTGHPCYWLPFVKGEWEGLTQKNNYFSRAAEFAEQIHLQLPSYPGDPYFWLPFLKGEWDELTNS